jgi:serine/threonine protein kinase
MPNLTRLGGPDAAFAYYSETYADGRFEVKKVISSGGEGYTLLCRDLLSGSLVALKGAWWPSRLQLAPDVAEIVNSQRATDLQDEVKVLRQLAERVHQVPTLVRMFSERSPTREAFAAEQGAYALHRQHHWDEWFAVYQFIGERDGTSETLGSFLRRTKQPLHTNELIELSEQIAVTLEALHRDYRDARSQGTPRISWVHCDIKPDNILIVGSPRRYFVIDFRSVARVEWPERGQGQDGVRTRARGVRKVATPAYAPPGSDDLATVDARFDIYSLGATLYECATGISPAWLAECSPTEGSNVQRRIRQELQTRGVHAAFVRIIVDCLNFNEEYRPSRIDGIRASISALRRSLAAQSILVG